MMTTMPSLSSNRLSTITLLDILFKHKTMIIIMVLITSVVTILVSYISPRQYETNATLMINSGREYLYRPEIGEQQAIYSGNRKTVELINTEIQILNSRDLKEQVINTIGVENIYPTLVTEDNPLEMAIQVFAKALVIKSIVDSNIIQLSYTHPNPVIAAKALNILINAYNEKHLNVYENSTLPFLEVQMRTSKEKLKSAEEKLENFRQQHGVYDIEKQTELLLGQRSNLEGTLNNTENAIKELEQKDISLKAQMKELPNTVPMYSETQTNDINSEPKMRLLELQMEEQKLLGKYTENSRLVQNIRDEINSVKNLIAAHGNRSTGVVRTGKNPLLEQLELESIRTTAELQSLFAKRDEIRHQIDQVNEKLMDIDTRQNDVRELERDVNTRAKNYNDYLQKLEDAKSESALDQMKNTSVRIIQSADVPVKPIGLSLKLRLVLGMFFGLLAGACLAFIAELNQRRLSNAYAVEQRLQLPILTVIPDRE
jgi:uncharacterized protein involved in exopolysaccharide biosynthesis